MNIEKEKNKQIKKEKNTKEKNIYFKIKKIKDMQKKHVFFDLMWYNCHVWR